MAVLCTVGRAPLFAEQAPPPAAPARPGAVPSSTVSPVLTLQVLLDRAHFSPGEIDGQRGQNTTRALAAFAKAHKLVARTADTEALALLGAPDVNTLTSYVIADADVAGPFTDVIPKDMMALPGLPALNYTSVIEQLGERFHTSPKLLRTLNPTAQFTRGEEIQVPNVGGVAPPVADRSAKIVVSKSGATLTVESPNGDVLFLAPVTSGSSHDPLPIGKWQVTGIARNPSFNYNPDLFWDANPAHAKAKIPPGPNNPVGAVWIDINKEHYGLHGTPEPSQIGHTSSHGCVRLTNWDAQTLAALVARGTAVEFIE
ncbi:MAG: L,D-transpeptidase [Vicinamibacterales bacterium]